MKAKKKRPGQKLLETCAVFMAAWEHFGVDIVEKHPAPTLRQGWEYLNGLAKDWELATKNHMKAERAVHSRSQEERSLGSKKAMRTILKNKKKAGN